MTFLKLFDDNAIQVHELHVCCYNWFQSCKIPCQNLAEKYVVCAKCRTFASIIKNLDFVQSVSLGAMAKTVPARAASARLDHVTMKMVDVKVDVWLDIEEQLVTKVLVWIILLR